MKIILLFIVLLLTGCFADSRRQPAPEALEAVAKAERFVVRHGLTTVGHPADFPMERVSLFDGIGDMEWTVAARKGLLRPQAVCVRSLAERGYSVMFQSVENADEYWFVEIRPESTGWLGHQPLRTIWKDCLRLSRAVR